MQTSSHAAFAITARRAGMERFNKRNMANRRKTIRHLGVDAPTVRHYVREEIQRRILSGESRLGEHVAQQRLAKELGVGQGSVREALVELRWLGLVDPVDRLGAFVGHIGAARLSEAYEVRELLEGLAARRACSRTSRSDVATLQEIADAVFNLSNDAKDEEAVASDRAFHLQIVNLSRNEMLLRLAAGYQMLGMAIRVSRDPQVVYQEHLRIVDAIQRNLSDYAENIARQHVKETRIAIAKQAANDDFVLGFESG